MAGERRPGLTSPFDEMLAENRKQLDALYGTSGTARALERPSASSTPAPASGQGRSDSVRFLNDRYGERWRYEVTERRREGDEVIVLAKLILEDQNISKSQFGRAWIGGESAAPELSGTANGIAFRIKRDDTETLASGTTSEEAAYRRAVEAALAKCAELL